MFCTKCGNEIREGAKFCNACGAPVDSNDSLPANNAPAIDSLAQSDEAQQVHAVGTQAESSSVTQPSSAPGDHAGKKASISSNDKRTIRIICIVAAIAVLFIALVTACLFFVNMNNHRGVPVRVNMSIAGTNIEDTSGVPLRIQGTDFENNPVDERVLVTTDDYSADLLRGSYTLTIAGDPVGDSGELYDTSTTSFPVEITDDGVRIDGKLQGGSSEAGSKDEPSLNVEFSPVPLDKMTDELFQKTRAWMTEYGLAQEEIDGYANAVNTYKQTALRKAAFGNFPAKFAFSSGVGGWGSVMTIQPDGSFEFSWHDSNLGERGPGYNATLNCSSFAGSFSVIEQVNANTFKLQLNELKSTHAAGESIDKDGLRTVWWDDEAYGLGDPTSSPRQGYKLYLPGISKSSLSQTSQGWLYGKADTLNCYVLVAPDDLTWASIN